MTIRKDNLVLKKLRPALPLLVCPLLVAMCLFTMPTCKQTTQPGAVKPDTTSHDFAFQIDTLGDGNSSLLNDVCIIDERNVWAVGEIYVKDATGQFVYPPYGAAHWDGQRWELKRLSAQAPGYITYLTPEGIFAFGLNDIWFASGGVHRFNGQSVVQSFWINSFPGNPNPILDPGQFIRKLWGTSNANLYAVGTQGAVAHYNGSSWQKLVSGTTVDIQDIWGAVDSKTGQPTIFAVASHRAAVPQAKQLLWIQNNAVSILSDTGLPFDLSGIWFTAGERYFVVGDGVYYSDVFGNSWQSDSSHPLLYKDAIRGLAQNDIFITGSFGLVSHYNGASWKHYTGSELPRLYGRYKASSYNGKLLVAVGWLDEQAVILRGKRV